MRWRGLGTVGASLGGAIGAASLVLWLAMDPLVQLVYDGYGPEVVRRVISGREVHGVAFYQALARERLSIWLLVSGLAGVVVLFAGLALRHGDRLRRQRFGLAGFGVATSIVLILLSHVADRSWPAHVVINEVMTSNANALSDDFGEHPDWIELYNPTTATIDLEGWALSDDPDRPQRWQFPTYHLEPGEHLVVFASGRDRAFGGGHLHTSFRIAQHSEPVLLTDDTGTEVDRIDAVPLPRDVSYGRDPERPRRFCYFVVPTPGEANSTDCFNDHERLGAPRFSASSGFYDEPFDLEMTPATPGATIYYTLDGSYPDPDSEHTYTYTEPLRITDRTAFEPTLARIPTSIADHPRAHGYFADRQRRLREQDLPPDEDSPRVHDFLASPDLSEQAVEQATVIRARERHSATTTATLFVGDDRRRDELPVISLVMNPEHLFDHDTGIYVPGATYDSWLDGDDHRGGWNVPANYNQRGRDWERPFADRLYDAVVFEYCSAGGGCTYQRDVGIRIHGRGSRQYPQKSLRLYARNDYGDRRFNEPLFEAGDAPIGHRRLILRNSGQDQERTMLADGFLQSLLHDFEADTQAYQPAAVFINGEYWGLHNLRERYDHHYLEVVHGADPDTVDLVDNSGGAVGEDRMSGPVEVWYGLLDDLDDLDPEDDAFVAAVEAAIDVDSFFDFIIAHAFFANVDSIGNNARWWRVNAPASGAAGTSLDGRWRWLIADFDLWGDRRRGDVDFDLLDERLVPEGSRTARSGFPFLFQRMVSNPGLRERFVTRFADRINTTFDDDHTSAELDRAVDRIEDEIGRHVDRWQRFDVDEWHEHVRTMRAFLEARPDAQRSQLVELFDLDDPAELTIDGVGDGGSVRVNSLTLDGTTPGMNGPNSWRGLYFPGHTLTLEALPGDSHRFERWEGVRSGLETERRLELEFDGDLQVRAIFAAD